MPASNGPDMIPSLLQIVEATVLGIKNPHEESMSQIRHKILDRLIALYLM